MFGFGKKEEIKYKEELFYSIFFTLNENDYTQSKEFKQKADAENYKTRLRNEIAKNNWVNINGVDVRSSAIIKIELCEGMRRIRID